MRLAAAALGALGALGASPVAAEEAPDDGEVVPDPRARRAAAEANLEPRRMREGLAIGFGIGPSMQIGFGIEASGTGPGVELRIGASATERLVWFVGMSTAGTPQGQTATGFNQTSLLSVGAQVFVLETLWLRAGAGLAHLGLQRDDAGAIERRSGFGGYAGGGIDLMRRGRFALSGDFTVVAAAFRDGATAATVAHLGLTWY